MLTDIAVRVFARVLAGVDDTDAGLDAAVQAGRLAAPDGLLELVTAVNLIDCRLQGWPQERIDATLESEGGPWLDRAAAVVGRQASTRLVNAPPLRALLDEAARYDATLIAVGSHEHTRVTELLIGGVAGPLLVDRLPDRPGVGRGRPADGAELDGGVRPAGSDTGCPD